MAQEAGDGLSLNEDRPDIDQPEGYDYRELQHIKKGIRIRLEKEHSCAAATMATDSAGGEHLNGSAVAYEGAGPITKRPDTSTDLADNATDRGRLWLDDNYDPPILKRWTGAAWEVIGRMLADAESLVITLVNEKQENTDGGRETKLIFKGEKADGTAHEIAMIQVSHDGTGDDFKGDIILYVNDGNDAAGSLTEVLRIDSAGKATFTGAVTVTGVITNSEIPVFTKGVVANNAYLQSRNAAGNGNVNILIVGTDNIPHLVDGTTLTSDAAPTANHGIANKKYVDNQDVANRAAYPIKGWVNFNGTNAGIADSYNVASVVRNSLGNYTITWTTPFASANYCISGMCRVGSDNGSKFSIVSMAAESCTVVTCDSGNTLIDSPIVTLMAIGD